MRLGRRPPGPRARADGGDEFSDGLSDGEIERRIRGSFEGQAPAVSTSGSGPSSSSGKAEKPSAGRRSWEIMQRWGALAKAAEEARWGNDDPLSQLRRAVVLGGGSFGTAMACALARRGPHVDVVLVVRDPALCTDICGSPDPAGPPGRNTRYLPDHDLPRNVRAVTSAAEAFADTSSGGGADSNGGGPVGLVVHAVPVQHSRILLTGLRDVLPGDVPVFCLSKGLEVASGGLTMDEASVAFVGGGGSC